MMLKKVVLSEDPFAPDTWETVETEDLCGFLAGRFDEFPTTARIYHNQVSEENDVTPQTEVDIQRLQALEGVFYVVVHAADPVTIVAVVAIAAITAIALSSRIPETPEPMVRKQDNSSPNNELSERKNRPRINGRIPDIFGTVRSTPDLIAPTYNVYENSLKTEHSLLCIGRGSYDIPVESVREGSTPLAQITNNTIEIFSPGVNPDPVESPQLRIGGKITEKFLSTEKNRGVNGQTVNPFRDPIITGSSDIGFRADYHEDGNHKFYVENDGTINFRNFISAGDALEVSNSNFLLRRLDLTIAKTPSYFHVLPAAVDSGFGIIINNVLNIPAGGTGMVRFENVNIDVSGNIYNLDGVYLLRRSTPDIYILQTDPPPLEVNPNWSSVTKEFSVESGYSLFDLTEDLLDINVDGEYEVSGVDEDRIYLLTASDINPTWEDVLYQQRGSNQTTLYQSPTLENKTGSVVGPFTIDDPETEEVILNFGALQGLYKDDGTNQTEINVEMEVTIIPVDSFGVSLSDPLVFPLNVNGSSVSKSPRFSTGQFKLPTPNRCTVSCKRITEFVSGFTGQVVEEVKWVDLYGAKGIGSLNFGDITIVRSKARATAEATSAENRELNMLVTRKIPQRINGSDFTTELFPTNRADDIFSFVALDPRIGNRAKDELDFDNIYSTVQQIEDYFGSSIATEFNYTFDSDNLSFEEVAFSIAKAVFCVAYRRGSQIKLSFEEATEISTLLFNHRNKLPGSETRTVRFGNQNDYDGVEFEYVDPTDDSVQTFYLPDNNSINPQRVDIPGIRNKLQAHFHAYRLWNKVQFQHVAADFEATQEADLLVLGDRILNADNTRPNIQDGEIEGMFGLELTLSQNADLSIDPPYTIFLQSPDGSIESIGIVAGSEPYKVVLANALTFGLSVDSNNFAKTTYLIVGSSDIGISAFLITEKQPTANFTSTITAINYDSRYYDNDKDVENGIVDENGNPI